MSDTYQPEQELRLAVVMYGGVSLAIYMYGVAQELFNLVRATAPSRSYADGAEPPSDLAFPECESTEAVYRSLAKLLPLDGAAAEAAGAPVRTRFVVDIVSGTSAGGINGICLAKALVNEADLDDLKEVWLKEGDIGALLNDQESGPYYEQPPRSLLSGQRMLDKLVAAITNMSSESAEPSRLVDELDLWVTATDLEGLEVPIQIANATPTERRHANRYHFRYAAAEGVNDLDGRTDGFVAYAARSTSAFPFAFEPVSLDDLERLGSVPDDAWTRFYSAYDSAAPPAFRQRSFSDGGILDNKPFSYATGSLVGRYASLPVERKLVYVEPAPAGPGDRPPRERWNAIDTTRAALLGIPQAETIRQDVQVVLARNRTIERVRDVVSNFGQDPRERERLEELARRPAADEWREQAAGEAAERGAWGPEYGVYHRVKTRGVVDFLARVLVRAAGFDPMSDEAFAVHYLVRAWKETHYSEAGDGARASENALLADFDVPYRLRRLDFVLRRIKELQTGDAAEFTRVLGLCGVSPELAPGPAGATEVLIGLKAALGDVRRELGRAEHRLAESPGELPSAIAQLGIGRSQLRAVLANADDTAMLAVANELLGANSLDDVTQVIREQLGTAAARARAGIEEHLGPPVRERELTSAEDVATTLSYALRFAYDTFEAYDIPLYLLQLGTPVGETNPVDIVRISPQEADGPPQATRNLAGLRLHHFGAFLDEDWRRNDMVWGRLDGAECLLKALLPADHPKLDELVREAHRRILDDYRRELELPEPADLGAWFAELPVAVDPADEPTRRALDRAAVVMADLAEALLPRRGEAAGPSRAVVAGVRESLVLHEDGPAVAAVRELLWSQPAVRRASLGLGAVSVAGVAGIAAGGLPRLAGCVAVGATGAFATVGLGVRWGIGVGVGKALTRVRRAVHDAVFTQ